MSRRINDCSCDIAPASEKRITEAGPVVEFICHKCKKRTPELLENEARKFWNSIACRSDFRNRLLRYSITGIVQSDNAMVIDEHHGESHIRARLYHEAHGWIYDYTFVIAGIAGSATATLFTHAYQTSAAAKNGIFEKIQSACRKNKTAAQTTAQFVDLKYNQLELFPK